MSGEVVYTDTQLKRKEQTRKILELHAQGMTGQKIAEALGISPSTVSRTLKKANMGVNYRLALFDAEKLLSYKLRMADKYAALSIFYSQIVDDGHLLRSDDPEVRHAAYNRLRRIKRKGDLGQWVADCAEKLRKVTDSELNLQREIFSIREIKKFHDILHRVLNEVDPDVARRFYQALQEDTEFQLQLTLEEGMK